MYPGPFPIFGYLWTAWNLAFLFAITTGWLVYRRCQFLYSTPPVALSLRYLFIVYICAVGAQAFSYLVDADTVLVPDDGRNLLRYYFDPLAGPKTLYGALLALPLAVVVAYRSRDRARILRELDASTPALMTILAFARIGCFLQGCCYGLRSDFLGIRFAPGSIVHADQFFAGHVLAHNASLPVLPTQLICAIACLAIALVTYQRYQKGIPDVFVSALTWYSSVRFVVEFLRADTNRNHFGPLSTSQWIALGLLAAISIRHSSRRAVRS